MKKFMSLVCASLIFLNTSLPILAEIEDVYVLNDYINVKILDQPVKVEVTNFPVLPKVEINVMGLKSLNNYKTYHSDYKLDNIDKTHLKPHIIETYLYNKEIETTDNFMLNYLIRNNVIHRDSLADFQGKTHTEVNPNMYKDSLEPFSKSDLVMSLIKAYEGVQNSRPVLAMTEPTRMDNDNKEKYVTEIHGANYTNPLPVDFGLNDVKINYTNFNDYWVYINPNVYELYLDIALEKQIINQDEVLNPSTEKTPAYSQYLPQIYPNGYKAKEAFVDTFRKNQQVNLSKDKFVKDKGIEVEGSAYGKAWSGNLPSYEPPSDSEGGEEDKDKIRKQVLFILDNSGSMQTTIDSAINACYKVTQENITDESVQFLFMSYNSDMGYTARKVTDWSVAKDVKKPAIAAGGSGSHLGDEGTSSMMNAQVFSLFTKDVPEKEIIHVADEAWTYESKANECDSIIFTAKQLNVKISSIGTRMSGVTTHEEIAKQTGGSFSEMNGSDIGDAIEDLVNGAFNQVSISKSGTPFKAELKKVDLFKTEALTYIEALKIIETSLRRYEKELTKTEVDIINYKFGMNITDVNKDTICYLIAKGILDWENPYETGNMGRAFTNKDAITLLYRIKNVNARKTFEFVQLTDNDTKLSDIGFSRVNASIQLTSEPAPNSLTIDVEKKLKKRIEIKITEPIGLWNTGLNPIDWFLTKDGINKYEESEYSIDRKDDILIISYSDELPDNLILNSKGSHTLPKYVEGFNQGEGYYEVMEVQDGIIKLGKTERYKSELVPPINTPEVPKPPAPDLFPNEERSLVEALSGCLESAFKKAEGKAYELVYKISQQDFNRITVKDENNKIHKLNEVNDVKTLGAGLTSLEVQPDGSYILKMINNTSTVDLAIANANQIVNFQSSGVKENIPAIGRTTNAGTNEVLIGDLNKLNIVSLNDRVLYNKETNTYAVLMGKCAIVGSEIIKVDTDMVRADNQGDVYYNLEIIKALIDPAKISVNADGTAPLITIHNTEQSSLKDSTYVINNEGVDYYSLNHMSENSNVMLCNLGEQDYLLADWTYAIPSATFNMPFRYSKNFLFSRPNNDLSKFYDLGQKLSNNLLNYYFDTKDVNYNLTGFLVPNLTFISKDFNRCEGKFRDIINLTDSEYQILYGTSSSAMITEVFGKVDTVFNDYMVSREHGLTKTTEDLNTSKEYYLPPQGGLYCTESKIPVEKIWSNRNINNTLFSKSGISFKTKSEDLFFIESNTDTLLTVSSSKLINFEEPTDDPYSVKFDLVSENVDERGMYYYTLNGSSYVLEDNGENKPPIIRRQHVNMNFIQKDIPKRFMMSLSLSLIDKSAGIITLAEIPEGSTIKMYDENYTIVRGAAGDKTTSILTNAINMSPILYFEDIAEYTLFEKMKAFNLGSNMFIQYIDSVKVAGLGEAKPYTLYALNSGKHKAFISESESEVEPKDLKISSMRIEFELQDKLRFLPLKDGSYLLIESIDVDGTGYLNNVPFLKRGDLSLNSFDKVLGNYKSFINLSVNDFNNLKGQVLTKFDKIMFELKVNIILKTVFQLIGTFVLLAIFAHIFLVSSFFKMLFEKIKESINVDIIAIITLSVYNSGSTPDIAKTFAYIFSLTTLSALITIVYIS